MSVLGQCLKIGSSSFGTMLKLDVSVLGQCLKNGYVSFGVVLENWMCQFWDSA
jgi:hypothetical protein